MKKIEFQRFDDTMRKLMQVTHDKLKAALDTEKQEKEKKRKTKKSSAGIRRAVLALNAAGIVTFESCEGGPGHAFLEPTVRFHGDMNEGLSSVAVLRREGFKVMELRRIWRMIAGELGGPMWDIVLVEKEQWRERIVASTGSIVGGRRPNSAIRQRCGITRVPVPTVGRFASNTDRPIRSRKG